MCVRYYTIECLATALVLFAALKAMFQCYALRLAYTSVTQT